LPYFLTYYAERGVSRFFIVDHASRDNTLGLFKDREDVGVFQAAGSYRQAGDGILWIRCLLDFFGQNRWCLVVDADERLIYPGWKLISLSYLCQYFDSEGATRWPQPCSICILRCPSPRLSVRRELDPLCMCRHFVVGNIRSLGLESAYFRGYRTTGGWNAQARI